MHGSAASGGGAPGGPAAPPPLPLRICSVPEHFALPIMAAIKSGDAARAGNYSVSFTPVPGGTGAMVASVLSGEHDVAVALTEGIVAAVVNQSAANAPAGKRLRYCGQYVQSPLRWMVVTGAGRGLSSLADVRALLDGGAADGDGQPRQLRVSVSRLGSGSHLMAYVLATQQGWPAERLTFTVDRDFRSMRRAVCEGSADVFMWEWFMTKPFVDARELGVLGHIDTPWPCFGVLAREGWLAEPGHARMLRDVLRVVQAHAAAFVRAEDESCELICASFGLRREDAQAWMRAVRFAPDTSAPRAMLHGVLAVLASVGVVSLPPVEAGAAAAAPGGSVPRGFLEATVVDTSVCQLTGPEVAEPAAAPPAAAASAETPPRAAAAAADSGSTPYAPEGASCGRQPIAVDAAALQPRSATPVAAPTLGTPLAMDGSVDVFTLPNNNATDVFTLPAQGSPASSSQQQLARVASLAGFPQATAGAARSRASSLCSTGSSSSATSAVAAAAAAAAAVAGTLPPSSLSPGKPSTRGEGLWRLKSGDSLPVSAGGSAGAGGGSAGGGGAQAEAELRAQALARKAGALAEVLAHLASFGGAVVADTQHDPPASVPFSDAPAWMAARVAHSHRRVGSDAADEGVALPLPPALLGSNGGIAAVPAPGGGGGGPARGRRNSRLFAAGAGWDSRDDCLFDLG